VAKFERLSAPFAGTELQHDIAATVHDLDTIPVADLMGLLARVGR